MPTIHDYTFSNLCYCLILAAMYMQHFLYSNFLVSTVAPVCHARIRILCVTHVSWDFFFIFYFFWLGLLLLNLKSQLADWFGFGIFCLDIFFFFVLGIDLYLCKISCVHKIDHLFGGKWFFFFFRMWMNSVNDIKLPTYLKGDQVNT